MDYPVEQDGYLIERDLLTSLAWYCRDMLDKEKDKEDRDREGVD